MIEEFSDTTSPLEPVAVVGMGCRFAGGVDSPESFWRLLTSGQDAISEVPPERWAAYADASPRNAAALRRVTRHGGFLDAIEGFDAEFFGITPREAELMDPQQRVVLEVSWEALEHAGIPPHTLAGSDTGVFIGVGSDDYGRRMLEDLPGIEAWTGIGAAFCAVANRVSYTLDLRGASMAVDTACSASLVAFHLALQALRAGECPIALAGGVNIIAGPGLTMVLDAAGAISPDGRSKSFDAAADGYGRGEGAGVVVLKRLSDAQRDGDRILAVIRGSAVHQDGRTDGIMAPSAEAQAYLLRQAYRNAGVAPHTVDYVEAHGTGTRAGDPIEATAMAEVFGAGRPADMPCLIGSVKPNIGHLEAGAGVAGVIKTVLALHHAHIPPQANFEEPNPAIPWDRARLRVVAEAVPWPASDHPRRAGVSGYGYGGTIGHIVLEQAPGTAGPEAAESTPDSDAVNLFPIFAATEAGARANAAALAEWLVADGANTPLDDISRTLAVHRSPAPVRAVVRADNSDQLVTRLRAFAEGEAVDGTESGTALPTAERGAVWVFSGHGSQWTGMGRELLGVEPAFTKVLDEIEPVFLDEMRFSPRQVLVDGALHDVDRIQPMIFAMQVGLASVWGERGLAPAAVIGHSVGEIAAAVVSGMLGLSDGARLVCRRSALLRRVAGKGAMAMVDLPFNEVVDRLVDRVDAAAAISSSPTSTVVAGDNHAIEALAAQWESESLVVRRVASDVAFHSVHMDPLLQELCEAAEGLAISEPRLPVYNTSLDDPRSTVPRDGAYWSGNLRNPVRFTQAVTAAVEDGFRAFVEVSAHPVVAHSIRETLDELGIEDAVVAHTLRRNRPERDTLLANLAALHCHGVPIDWAASTRGRLADLPHTAWQHRRFWYERAGGSTGGGTQHDIDSHTLLGGQIAVNGITPARLWQTYLDASCRPYPGDHPVQGVEIIPAAVLLNTFFTAAAEGGDVPGLADVTLRVPVAVSTPREVQVVRQEGTVRLASRILTPGAADADDADASWLTHTTAVVSPGMAVGEQTLDVRALRDRLVEVLENDFVIDRLAGVGVAAMGFPWEVRELRRADGELFGIVSARPHAGPPGSWASVLDAALSAASVVFPGEPVLRMPAHIREAAVLGSCPAEVLLHVKTVDDATAADSVDVTIAAPDGRALARLSGLRYCMLDSDLGVTASPRRLVSELAWRPMHIADDQPRDRKPVTSAVIVGDRVTGPLLGEALSGAGLPWTVLDSPEELADLRETLTSGTAVLVVPERAGGDGTISGAAVDATWLLTRTLKLLAASGAAVQPRLWCITRGVRESLGAASLGDAPLWGLGRVIGGEHPELWGGIVDLPEVPEPKTLTALIEVIRAQPTEDLVALRGTHAEVARLAPIDREPTRASLECRPDATYLITGGLGALGLEVAAWLAGRGARRLVLAGRRRLPPRTAWDGQTDPGIRRQIEAVRALEGLGVTVRIVAVDIADAEAVAAALSPQALDLPPIGGVVHAAGVLDNRMAVTLDEQSLVQVMRPKVAGALVLHELFAPGSLDFFTLFSSCGQLLGLTGQAGYASGNAFLDALATHRRALGDNIVSFAWTSWRGLGMSTSSQVIDAELEARGTTDISAEEAFRSWEFASRYDSPYFAVLRTVGPAPSAARPLLLAELVSESGEPADEQTTEGGWTLPAPEKLHDVLVDKVRGLVAAETKCAPLACDVRRPLREMGLDSVMTLVIRRRLEKLFGLSLPATLLWDRPTVTDIADYLAQRLSH
ncbi:type I polyketide synthase [Streptomyces guryensis]|uniref:Type I polyketide synthase n=1 Tax=Streptomyces guryensis TaxID=2886947 RepID=A0A9Q3VWZ8_9ACTN|nr:type I polyketide synthase [Streptomyces guryensis]MCD9878945.1 type I polyketide synthase [Streptomyces guryensis]